MLANCTRRILVLDDIIGSNANAVSINDFENNLKRYFENIVFENIKKNLENGNGKLSFYSQLISTQNLNKVSISQP